MALPIGARHRGQYPPGLVGLNAGFAVGPEVRVILPKTWFSISTRLGQETGARNRAQGYAFSGGVAKMS